MRSPALALTRALGLFVGLWSAAPALAAETATKSIVANATVAPRTSLSVSSDFLHFTLTSPNEAVTVDVDFVARARTYAAGEVVLTVESVRALEGPGGAADVEGDVRLAATDTTAAAPINPGVPVVARRWTGSGRREGRLVFAVRAAAPGTYALPLRFVLSAP